MPFNCRMILPVVISGLYCCFTGALLISYDNGLVNKLFYLAAVLFIIWLIIERKSPFNLTLLLLGLFLLFSALTTCWSDQPENLFRAIKHAIYLLLFFSVSYELRDYILKNNSLFILLVLIATGSAIVNLYLFYAQQPLFQRLQPVYGPTNIIDYAGFLCLGIIFAFYLLKENKMHKIPATMMLLILLFSLILSQSRMPVIALALALLVLFMNQRRWLLCHVAALGLLAVAVLVFYPDIITRDAVNGAPTPRIFTWWYVFEQLANHDPWFGFGYGNKFAHYFAPRNISYNNAHGVFISMLYYSGLSGFLLFSLYAVHVLRIAFISRKRDPLPLALFVFCMMNAITQGYKYLYHPIEIWLVFWFPLFIASAIIGKQKLVYDRKNTHCSSGEFRLFWWR